MLERDATPGTGGGSRAEGSVARRPNEKPREPWHELEQTFPPSYLFSLLCVIIFLLFPPT